MLQVHEEKAALGGGQRLLQEPRGGNRTVSILNYDTLHPRLTWSPFFLKTKIALSSNLRERVFASGSEVRKAESFPGATGLLGLTKTGGEVNPTTGVV